MQTAYALVDETMTRMDRVTRGNDMRARFMEEVPDISTCASNQKN